MRLQPFSQCGLRTVEPHHRRVHGESKVDRNFSQGAVCGASVFAMSQFVEHQMPDGLRHLSVSFRRLEQLVRALEWPL